MDKYGAATWRGIVKNMVMDKVIRPEGEGNTAENVVAIDKALEAAGVRNSSDPQAHDRFPEKDFIDIYDLMPKADRDLFKLVHDGKSASQMVEEAKEVANKSFKKPMFDWLGRNVE